MASICHDDVNRTISAHVNDQIRRAFVEFDIAQDEYVRRHVGMLASSPGAAVAGLERTALGCEYLIERHERLLKCLSTDSTLFGSDRDEFIELSGAASERTKLFASEFAYLTWFYTLNCQAEPKDEDYIALSIRDPGVMPTSLRDRGRDGFFAPDDLQRQLIVTCIEERLAELRERHTLLKETYTDPSRDESEIRRQVVEGAEGTRLLRIADLHERQYRRAMSAFHEGRRYAVKTGVLPGFLPEDFDLNGATVETAAVLTAETVAARRAEDARKRQARKDAATQASRDRVRAINRHRNNADQWIHQTLLARLAALKARDAQQPQAGPAAAACQEVTNVVTSSSL
jgi:hypothetical protein